MRRSERTWDAILEKTQGNQATHCLQMPGVPLRGRGGQLTLGPKEQKEEQEVDAAGWSALAPYEKCPLNNQSRSRMGLAAFEEHEPGGNQAGAVQRPAAPQRGFKCFTGYRSR